MRGAGLVAGVPKRRGRRPPTKLPPAQRLAQGWQQGGWVRQQAGPAAAIPPWLARMKRACGIGHSTAFLAQ